MPVAGHGRPPTAKRKENTTAHLAGAHGCGGFGIQLASGSFQLVHATCAANSTGRQVLRSNDGFAGSNGNLNVNPLFVSQATGDRHLGLASPCLGAADILQALLTQKDHDENSRILDHALTGAPATDIGAFERAAWDMAVGNFTRLYRMLIRP